MTRALRELSLNRSIVKVERDVALSAAAEAHARELVAAAIEAACARPWECRANAPSASWSTWMPCALRCSTRRPAACAPCARLAARFGKILPHLGTDGLRWAPRSSKPLRGVQNVLDVFDSHTFPPYATSAFVLAVLLRAARALFCFCAGPPCRPPCRLRYLPRALGLERADGGVLPYDYRKTCRSFLCRPSGWAVLAHGL